MTIKDLCEKYNCDYSGIYKKIKRKNAELEGHIIIQNGVIILDEFAENLLKPCKKREGTEHWTIERLKEKCEIETDMRKNAEIVADELRSQNYILQEEILKLKAENDSLQQQVNEIKQQLLETANKPVGLFGRR